MKRKELLDDELDAVTGGVSDFGDAPCPRCGGRLSVRNVYDDRFTFLCTAEGKKWTYFFNEDRWAEGYV